MIGLGPGVVRWLIAGVVVCGSLSTARAQPYTVRSGKKSVPAKPNANKTLVTVELLTGSEGVGIQVQQWRPVFEQLGFAVRVRRGVLGEKPELRERKQGPLRFVKVVGRIDRSGKLVFADRVFTRNDSAKLLEWLRELQSYGAAGSPRGKPLWGLSKAKFGALFSALSRPVASELKGQPWEIAIARIGLPEQYPLRLTTASRGWLQQEFPRVPPVRQNLKGFSSGTALAILLNDYGLGFRPLRTPEGQIEIVVDPLQKTTDAWPIGWKLKLSRPQTAPKMFELLPVELEDIKLLDVLNAVSVKTNVPIRIDYHRIEAKNIDIDNLRVSHPPKKTSWSLLLRGVTNPYKMTRRFQIDEQGKPFVWITTLEPGRPGR